MEEQNKKYHEFQQTSLTFLFLSGVGLSMLAQMTTTLHGTGQCLETKMSGYHMERMLKMPVNIFLDHTTTSHAILPRKSILNTRHGNSNCTHSVSHPLFYMASSHLSIGPITACSCTGFRLCASTQLHNNSLWMRMCFYVAGSLISNDFTISARNPAFISSIPQSIKSCTLSLKLFKRVPHFAMLSGLWSARLAT